MTIEKFVEDFRLTDSIKQKVEKLIEISEAYINENGIGFHFSDESEALVHEIAEEIKELPKIDVSEEIRREYHEENMKAEMIYLDMLLKMGLRATFFK